MTSLERALEYTNLEQESQEGNTVNQWPVYGNIRFDSVKLCYDSSKTPILKDINFNINSKEKIGVVGRTGAGKSSIVTVLYRLYDFDGKIEIDGVDIKTVPLKYLRYVLLYPYNFSAQ